VANRAISPNLALDQLVVGRRANGESIIHMGFGESRLPVFTGLVEGLTAGARRNSDGPVAGDNATRQAIAEYFTHRGVVTDASQIVLGPGAKALLLALQMVLPGDLVIPVPSWVSYAPQAILAGKHALPVPRSACAVAHVARLRGPGS